MKQLMLTVLAISMVIALISALTYVQDKGMATCHQTKAQYRAECQDREATEAWLSRHGK